MIKSQRGNAMFVPNLTDCCDAFGRCFEPRAYDALSAPPDQRRLVVAFNDANHLEADVYWLFEGYVVLYYGN